MKDETVSGAEDCFTSIVVNEDGVVSSVVSCFVEALVLIDDDFVGPVFGKDLYVAAVDDKTCVAGLN